MEDIDLRKKIRSLLASASSANDNARPIQRHWPEWYKVAAVSIIAATMAGIVAAKFFSDNPALVTERAPTVTMAPSNGSMAVIGPVTINNAASDKALRPWGTLDASERQQIRAEAYALFPATLLAEGNRTWTPIVGWMARRHGVNATNVRDIFRSQHDNLPRFYARLLDDRQAFKRALASFDRATLAEAWGATPPANADDRFAAWLDMATPSIREALGAAGTDAFIKKLKSNDDD